MYNRFWMGECVACLVFIKKIIKVIDFFFWLGSMSNVCSIKSAPRAHLPWALILSNPVGFYVCVCSSVQWRQDVCGNNIRIWLRAKWFDSGLVGIVFVGSCPLTLGVCKGKCKRKEKTCGMELIVPLCHEPPCWVALIVWHMYIIYIIEICTVYVHIIL